jgi:hypothetical protein
MRREKEEIDLGGNDENQIKRNEDGEPTESGNRMIVHFPRFRKIEGSQSFCDRSHQWRKDQRRNEGDQK